MREMVAAEAQTNSPKQRYKMRIKLDAENLYYGLGAASKWRDEGLVNFLEKGMLLRVTDPGDAGVYSMLIPADSMEVYEPRGMETLGFDFSDILPFLNKGSGVIELEAKEAENQVLQVTMTVGTRKYTVSAVKEEYINGNPNKVPQIDHSFIAEMDWEYISSFVDDYHKINDDGGGVYITVQNGMMWIWGKHDDNEIVDMIHLEDLDVDKLDYSTAFLNEDVDVDPREEEKINNLLSKDIIRNLAVETDKVRFCFDNYAPIKVVSEHDSGLKQSWIVTPRIPAQGSHKRIPERVLNERNVLE